MDMHTVVSYTAHFSELMTTNTECVIGIYRICQSVRLIFGRPLDLFDPWSLSTYHVGIGGCTASRSEEYRAEPSRLGPPIDLLDLRLELLVV